MPVWGPAFYCIAVYYVEMIKIISIVILLLIQEGLLSVTAKECTQSTGYPLSLSLPRKKSVVRLTPDMTIAVDWDIKPPTKGVVI